MAAAWLLHRCKDGLDTWKLPLASSSIVSRWEHSAAQSTKYTSLPLKRYLWRLLLYPALMSALFLWVFIGPTVALIFTVIRTSSSYKLVENNDKGPMQFIAREANPTLNGASLELAGGKQKQWNRLGNLACQWAIMIYSALVIWMGTLLLGSITFVTVYDIWSVFWSLVASTVCCRLIVEFELYG